MSALPEYIGRPENKELQPQRNAHINLTFPHLLCALAAILLAASSALSQKPAAGGTPLPPAFDKASDPLQWASNQLEVAHTLSEHGHYKESERLFREIISLYTEKLGPEHTNTLTSRHGLAVVLHDEGKYDEAEAEARAVLKLRERILGPQHLETLKTRGGLATILAAKGRFAEAEAEFRALLKIQERVLGVEHDDTLTIRNNLAVTLQQQDKLVEAAAELRAVLMVRARVLGPEDPHTLDSRNNLAAALLSQGKTSEAESEVQTALKLRKRVLGLEHPDTLMSWMNLANVFFDEGKYQEAEVEYRANLRIRERVLGPQHPDTLMLLYNLARCLEKQDKQDEALPLAQRAAEGALKVLGVDHRYTKSYEKLYERLTSEEESASGLYRRSYAAHARKEYERGEWLALESADAAKSEQPLDKSKVLQALQLAGLCALERSNALSALAHFTNAATFTDKTDAPLEWARNRSNTARALQAGEEYSRAELLLREIIPILSEQLGSEHPETLRSREAFAYILTQQGKHAEAETEFRALVGIQQRVLGA